MNKIGINDFRTYNFLSELSVSPSGEKTAFVAGKAKENGRGYDFNIHVIEKGADRQLTSMGDSRTYMWDGDNAVIFPGNRDKNESGTDFYKIELSGGEAKKVFSVPFKVMQVKRVNEDKIAFVSRFDHNKELLDKMTAEEREEEKDYIIIDELPYWFNGSGFINKTRKRLYIYSISENRVSAISNKWSDVDFVGIYGDRIVYTCSTYKDKKPKTNELHVFDTEKGTDEKVIGGGKYSIRSAGYSFGKLMVLMSDMKKYGVGQIPNFYSVEDGEVKLFKESDLGYGSSVGSDCRLGGGSIIKYTDDAIYYIKTVGTNSCLFSLDKDAKESVLVDGEGSVDMFDVKNGNYVYVGMRGVKLQEVCGKDGQLTHINEKVLEDKYVAVPEKTDIISDGVKIEGFVIKPIDYDENKKYPAIVDVHGGPRTAFGSVFFHEMQYWASMGYFVMFTNMRGSDGRGNEFADLRGKYGTIDFDDLMRFVDAVLKKYPQIDDKKVGITGGSYGGFMTNWAIGNTNRFAAAASQRSLTNWISLTNLADIGYTFDQEEVQGTAWRNMKRIWDQSPLKHANKAKTPTLFIHSEEDYRCLLSEGMQMFYAIKNAGCTARMCIFKGENHELSRSGKPIHRTRRLKEITQWFEKYLKGAK